MKQIKVTDTRMHKVTEHGYRTETALRANFVKEVPVADAELVLVECKPEEALFYCVRDFKNIISYNISQGLVKGIGKYYKPILISRTERPESL